MMPSRIAFTTVSVTLVLVFAWLCSLWSHLSHPPAPLPAVRPLPAVQPAIASRYVASTQKEKYHLTTCDFVWQIAEGNRHPFNTAEEAEAAGYEPCSRCLPRQIARAK